MKLETSIYEFFTGVFELAKVPPSQQQDLMDQLSSASLVSAAAEMIGQLSQTTNAKKQEKSKEKLDELVSTYGEEAVKMALARALRANTTITLVEFMQGLSPEEQGTVTTVVNELNIHDVTNLPKNFFSLFE